jgi:hypothetical protein
MSMDTTTTYDRELAERAAEQLRRHLADPFRCPKYLPADEDGLETEAWTAGGAEEPDA